MNKMATMNVLAVLAATLLLSACGAKPDSTANGGTPSASPSATAQAEPTVAPTAVSTEQPTAIPTEETEQQILIVIDQTPKPIEGNSFDFAVKQRPEGYALSQIEWKSDKNDIVNTLQEAVEHGQSGGDGFYISGDGQFMGFIYPDDMKKEKGEVKFTFENDQGQKLTWKKTITLK
ncbi:hypothetical protein A8L34_08800 [Bacillus sp. FJAT-27264]|uniref:hypothetical protein n=1 Tax=Paenibacillus sp. (strain DSM 101736 / FJAT-27264) TaxID=1850362 RepID=UPI000807FC9B|nr:hypothetical protein [Bacillus sp. FJAT-27264]OBZ14062.1 hypothetical protein A8L34_08800 [Bacillus sp. FJAT-27264]